MLNDEASVDLYCEFASLRVAYNGVEALGVAEKMAEHGIVGLYDLLEHGLCVGSQLE